MRKLLRNVRQSIGSSYAISSVYHEIRLRREARKSDSPVIVFQMGKVGSTTIVKALHESMSETPVFHVHFLSEEGVADAKHRLRELTKRSNANAWCLYESDFVRRYLLKRDAGQKLKLVTLFREPVSRNISSFFYNVHKYVPGFNQYSIEDDRWLSELTNCYLKQFPEHDYSLNWFDLEMKKAFDVDVYDYQFEKEYGYTIIQTDDVDILILKLEKLKEISGQALSDYFRVGNIRLKTENTSDEQSYTEFYKRFIESVKLPEWYLDTMYDSRYMRHFYTEDEIFRFRARWKSLP